MQETENQDYPAGKNSLADDESEIDLYECWLIIVKRRKLIGRIILVGVILTILVSLFMHNIYEAKSVIMPVTPKDSGGSGAASVLMQQMGGMQGILPGLGIPNASSSAEIVLLLQSDVLREKIITRYNLLPVLFSDNWDENIKTWKKPSLIKRLLNMLKPGNNKITGEEGAPSIGDGLRELDDLVGIITNTKDDSIIITVDNKNPYLAATIAENILDALNVHMSSEAKRVAATNKKYLEEQLVQTADPLIRQKAYNLIAQQIETEMMAEVKENFAFKIIDPPRVPDKKLKPKRALMAVLSLIVFSILAVFVAFFLTYVEKVKNRQNDLLQNNKKSTAQ